MFNSIKWKRKAPKSNEKAVPSTTPFYPPSLGISSIRIDNEEHDILPETISARITAPQKREEEHDNQMAAASTAVVPTYKISEISAETNEKSTAPALQDSQYDMSDESITHSDISQVTSVRTSMNEACFLAPQGLTRPSTISRVSSYGMPTTRLQKHENDAENPQKYILVSIIVFPDIISYTRSTMY